MTEHHRTTGIRPLATVVLIVGVALAVGAVGTASAAQNTTDTARLTVDNSSPIVLYLGERDLDLRDYPEPKSGTLIGLSESNRGSVATFFWFPTMNVTRANRFVEGEYAFQTQEKGFDETAYERPDLVVKRPRVTDIAIHQGQGTDGADVTDGTLDRGAQFTVTGRFNFGAAAPAQVTVVDQYGTDVTDSALDGSVADNDHWLEGPDATVVFDTQSLDPGRYTITVHGSDGYTGTDGNRSETDFSVAERAATLTIGDGTAGDTTGVAQAATSASGDRRTATASAPGFGSLLGGLALVVTGLLARRAA
jgi:hypothetical protein